MRVFVPYRSLQLRGLEGGCRSRRNTKVPWMRCGSKGVTKLAGEIGRLHTSEERARTWRKH